MQQIIKKNLHGTPQCLLGKHLDRLANNPKQHTARFTRGFVSSRLAPQSNRIEYPTDHAIVLRSRLDHRARTCVLVRVRVRACACACVCMCMCGSVCLCLCLLVRVRVRVCVCVCVCVCVRVCERARYTVLHTAASYSK